MENEKWSLGYVTNVRAGIIKRYIYTPWKQLEIAFS